jgi:hypothetical protein
VIVSIFTSDAVAMLHESALGSLRDVDRVATAALEAACRKRRKLVERTSSSACSIAIKLLDGNAPDALLLEDARAVPHRPSPSNMGIARPPSSPRGNTCRVAAPRSAEPG